MVGYKILKDLLSRREFIKKTTLAGAALTTGALLSGCGNKSKGQSDEELKIGYIPITDATPLLIAHARGFYEEEGLKAKRPVLIRGWSALSEAFMARRFNLCHLLSPIPIYMRYNLNYPVKVVAWDHINNSAITVGARSRINSLKELGGKQIAIPYWYSVHNVIIQLVLRNYGIEPVIQDKNIPLKKDQTNIFVMAPPDMPAAMASGAIDGYIVAEPFNAAGEMLAGGKIIRFSGDIWKDHACCVAVLNENDINNNPQWAQKVVNAVVKAELWARNNLEETAHILSREGKGYLPLPEKVILRSMTKYDLETYGVETGSGAIRHVQWNTRRIEFQPYQFKSYTRKLVQLLRQTKVQGEAAFLQQLSTDLVVEDLMNYELVTAAVEKVGGHALFSGIDSPTPFIREEVIEV